MNIEEVKDFIRTANKKELDEIQTVFNTARQLVREEIRREFRVDDIVKIKHNSIPGDLLFEITKINRKNVKVTCTSNKFKSYTVSPTLLEKV
jgi:hypothetical protein